jgi:hypothetical protein
MPSATMIWIGGLGVLATGVLLGMRDTTGRDLRT